MSGVRLSGFFWSLDVIDDEADKLDLDRLEMRRSWNSPTRSPSSSISFLSLLDFLFTHLYSIWSVFQIPWKLSDDGSFLPINLQIQLHLAVETRYSRQIDAQVYISGRIRFQLHVDVIDDP